MNYFPCGDGNTKVKVDGVLVNLKNIQLRSTGLIDVKYPDAPNRGGSAVVLNNEIHVLGSTVSADSRKHYKWNGSIGGAWTEVSTLPYAFDSGVAVVLNNEIHLLKGTNHYKWDGSTWTEVSTLPNNTSALSAVVFGNEIHAFGIYKNYTNKHFKWDGSTWTEVGAVPVSGRRNAVVFGNEIHIFGSTPTSDEKEYKWNGSTWTEVGDQPSTYDLTAVVFGNEIHVLGSNSHFKRDGNKWIKERDLPYSFGNGVAVVLDDGIHILFSASSTVGHYCLNVDNYLIVVNRH